MRRTNSELATFPEVLAEIGPLVDDTRHDIARVARSASVGLDSLSPDSERPISFPSTMYGSDGRFFRERIREFDYSPRVNVDRTLPGYEGLYVMKAVHQILGRWRDFPSIESLRYPGSPASIRSPFHRPITTVILEITDNAGTPLANNDRKFAPEISDNGFVKGFGAPTLPQPSYIHGQGYRYRTPEEMKVRYANAYRESLAIAALIGESMGVFDVDLSEKTSALNGLREEWDRVVPTDSAGGPIYASSRSWRLAQYRPSV